MKKARFSLYISQEAAEKISVLSEKMNRSKSGVATLAVEAGISALSMAFDDKMRDYFEGVLKEYEEKPKSRKTN